MNCIVSGLLWRGPPRTLIDAARTRRLELYSSLDLLGELAEVLARDKFASRLAAARVSAADLFVDFCQLAHLVAPTSLGPNTDLRDPDDAAVPACAVAADADAVVSGDRDLLTLRSFRAIPILSPSGCAAMLARDP